MNSELALRVGILRILDQVGGHLMPEETLLLQARMSVAPPPSTAEFSAAIQALEGLRMAVSSRSQLGGPLKWKITEAGRAMLAEL